MRARVCAHVCAHVCVCVCVCVHRAGYVPQDYPTESEWRARDIIERSNAAKCPTVAYQLAGRWGLIDRDMHASKEG